MNRSALLLSLLLAAPAAAQPCLSLTSSRGTLSLDAHSFSTRYADMVQFVPYGGGIAALLLFHYDIGGSLASPTPLNQWATSPCDRLDMTVVGWWWQDFVGHALDGDTIELTLPGSPVIDLYRTPTSFVVHPMLFSASRNDSIGLLCRRPAPRYEPAPFPQFAAYLVAPTRGWW